MTVAEVLALATAGTALLTAVASLVAAFQHQGQIGGLKVTTNSLQHENARLNLALGTAQGEAAAQAADAPRANPNPAP